MSGTLQIGGIERNAASDALGNRENATGGWTAIVLAGQRPGVDPLASAFGETYKALVPIGGMTMLDRVLRTLLDTPAITRIVVLAQNAGELLRASTLYADDDRLTAANGASGISASIAAIAGTASAPWPVLVTTADHPLLSRAMIEAFLAGAGATDLSVGAVERRVVLAGYPESRRTWLKFRDGAYSGANLFALRNDRARAALELWARAEKDRKQAFRLFWHFGPILALRAITRTIGFGEAVRRAGATLGLSATVVPLAFAEAAIDVDKVADYRLVEKILTKAASPL